VPTHGETREIHALRIDVEVVHRLLQRRDRDVSGCADPLRIARDLRKDDQRRVARRILANRSPQADLRRQQSILSPLARAVQE
jgi:hypothetical protein